jgi:diaminohydroxyphosphoribosylaminopyrimidine deaminase/5-amino-6-(5-phosphoribosylamino)uracil reductase
VNGKGIKALRRHGIGVQSGLLKKESQRLNEDFLWSIVSKQPWITLKLAMTLDGKIADFSGHSKWITNMESRTFVHELRRKHAAIAVGANTLYQDNPHLTVRHVPGVSPVRFVFSSNPYSFRSTHFVNGSKKIRSIIVTSGGKSGEKKINPEGPEIWYTGKARNPSNLALFCDMAYKDGLTSILVEGGAGLASSFIEAGMVNRLYLFYGNKILGSGLSGIAFRKKNALNSAVILENPEMLDFKQTFALTGNLTRRM